MEEIRHMMVNFNVKISESFRPKLKSCRLAMLHKSEHSNISKSNVLMRKLSNNN